MWPDFPSSSIYTGVEQGGENWPLLSFKPAALQDFTRTSKTALSLWRFQQNMTSLQAQRWLGMLTLGLSPWGSRSTARSALHWLLRFQRGFARQPVLSFGPRLCGSTAQTCHLGSFPDRSGINEHLAQEEEQDERHSVHWCYTQVFWLLGRKLSSHTMKWFLTWNALFLFEDIWMFYSALRFECILPGMFRLFLWRSPSTLNG